MPYSPGVSNTAPQSIAQGNQTAIQAMLALIGAFNKPSTPATPPVTGNQYAALAAGYGPVTATSAENLFGQPNAALLTGEGYRPNLPATAAKDNY
jgi:hypothetical protein